MFFRKFDSQNFGFINQQQFLSMLRLIDPDDKIDSEQILETQDPNNTDLITFNQIVSNFTKEEVQLEEEGEFANLLQVIYAL